MICFGELRVGGIGDVLVPALPGSLRAGALLFHGAVEACPVDLDSGVARDVFDEIARQAVGVVQRERLFCRRSVPVAKIRRARLRIDLPASQPDIDGASKAAFLFGDDFLNVRAGFAHQFGIGSRHQFADGEHHVGEKGLGRIEQARVAHAAAHDFAQHVAAAFVRRDHAVGDQKRRGAGMIRDDAK